MTNALALKNFEAARNAALDAEARGWVIVRINPPGRIYKGPATAELAPTGLVGVDESDAVHEVALRRLSIVG